MTSTKLAWTPVTKGFGAEVDLDLNDMPSAVGNELRELLDERQLLVFRGQDIDYDTQRQVISMVGNPLVEVKYVSTVHDTKGDPLAEPADPDPRVVMFHSDYTFLKAGPLEGISLYAEDVSGNTSPGFQGTRFTSARNAYLSLPDDDRAALDGRTAIQLHALELSTEEQLALKQVPFDDEVRGKVSFWAEHPLFYPDPRTGEPVLLYIPWFTQSIVGMSPEESQQWFAKFDPLLYDEDLIYTHRWENGDLLVWDNTAIQHCKETVGAFDGPMPRRTLRRVSFGAEEPNIYNQVDGFGNKY